MSGGYSGKKGCIPVRGEFSLDRFLSGATLESRVPKMGTHTAVRAKRSWFEEEKTLDKRGKEKRFSD